MLFAVPRTLTDSCASLVLANCGVYSAMFSAQACLSRGSRASLDTTRGLQSAVAYAEPALRAVVGASLAAASFRRRAVPYAHSVPSSTIGASSHGAFLGDALLR
jgi:hypothetical protein